ncbi:PREDICTED: basic salivary proline-rich protein 2-like [Dipodomys ordii]|uniref:Basic salivary proline-rich protein 2-like n=1 Tax=Dipodomys ordii TaxID=10020 RepID=A0A1S3EUS5_DIPOR|nr:PREDICTED: basic salivary proline-rich protein 2-like [Dipodomys ordii]
MPGARPEHLKLLQRSHNLQAAPPPRPSGCPQGPPFQGSRCAPAPTPDAWTEHFRTLPGRRSAGESLPLPQTGLPASGRTQQATPHNPPERGAQVLVPATGRDRQAPHSPSGRQGPSRSALPRPPRSGDPHSHGAQSPGRSPDRPPALAAQAASELRATPAPRLGCPGAPSSRPGVGELRQALRRPARPVPDAQSRRSKKKRRGEGERCLLPDFQNTLPKLSRARRRPAGRGHSGKPGSGGTSEGGRRVRRAPRSQAPAPTWSKSRVPGVRLPSARGPSPPAPSHPLSLSLSLSAPRPGQPDVRSRPPRPPPTPPDRPAPIRPGGPAPPPGSAPSRPVVAGDSGELLVVLTQSGSGGRTWSAARPAPPRTQPSLAEGCEESGAGDDGTSNPFRSLGSAARFTWT